jgi:Zn-dependent protease with chaperone function
LSGLGGHPFRLSVAAACFTALLLTLAAAIPLLVRHILLGAPIAGQDVLSVCIFLLTSADWQSYLLLYIPLGLLILGLLSGLISLFCQWYRTRRLVLALRRFASPRHEEALAPLLHSLGLSRKVDIIDVTQPIAFCYGWTRPRICLATGAIAGLNKQEIEALLLHERHHMLNRDPLKIAISRALTRTFFFLPLLGALQQRYMVAKEIEADTYVLQSQSTEKPLLGAIFKLLSQQAKTSEHSTVAVAGYTDSLNQRLDFLLLEFPSSGVRLTSPRALNGPSVVSTR